MRLFPTEPKRILRLCGVLLAIGILGALLWSNREPKIEGRKLNEWLNQLNVFGFASETPEMVEAKDALYNHYQIVIPRLLKMLDAKESFFTKQLITYLPADQWSKFRLTDTESERLLAYNGLWVLASYAQPAIPILERHLLADDMRAAAVLTAIGPPAFEVIERCLTSGRKHIQWGILNGFGDATNHLSDATPMLLTFMRTEPDRELKVWSASLLAMLRVDEMVVTPVLIDGLLFGDNATRGVAAKALTNYPVTARLHLADLQALTANQSNTLARRRAIDALKILAPELIPKD